MGIEISADSANNHFHTRPGSEAPNTEGRSFKHNLGQKFGSYEHVLKECGLEQKQEGEADIFFQLHETDNKLGVRITVGNNSVIVSSILTKAPTQVANAIVKTALALGAITLPKHLEPFIKANGMAGGDLAAMIMGRYIHVTPEGEIFTPPGRVVGGSQPTKWHRINEANEANLIIPDWLHGGIDNVTINGEILEGVTWKGEKIRIRSNGSISILDGDKEKTIPKENEIDLIIPEPLVGKINFNGKPDHLTPIYGHVGDIYNEKVREYISIGRQGIVKKMGKKQGDWTICSDEELKRLGQYPTQEEIQKIRQGGDKTKKNQLAEKLQALQQ